MTENKFETIRLDGEYEFKEKVELLDTKQGKLVDKKDLSPWENIKLLAETLKFTIQQPRKGCKHCYGRGYVGFVVDSKQPVACNCIFPTSAKNNDSGSYIFNRETKRKMKKQMRKTIKKHNLKKQIEQDLESSSVNTNTNEVEKLNISGETNV